jgi:hypothetical protein
MLSATECAASTDRKRYFTVTDMKTSTLVALAITAASAAPAFAEEAHRELGAHVHGRGTLNIAVENTRVSIELEAPGMDIVGFEHEASSVEQKAAVSKAKEALGDPLSLFKLPATAACKLADAKTEVETEDAHDHDHDHGDKDDKHADHDDGHDHDDHAGHTAFHVTYAIDCAKPENLTSITFDYFKAFAGAKALDVSVVTDKAQNKFEVTREKPVLDLAGAI